MADFVWKKTTYAVIYRRCNLPVLGDDRSKRHLRRLFVLSPIKHTLDDPQRLGVTIRQPNYEPTVSVLDEHCTTVGSFEGTVTRSGVDYPLLTTCLSRNTNRATVKHKTICFSKQRRQISRKRIFSSRLFFLPFLPSFPADRRARSPYYGRTSRQGVFSFEGFRDLYSFRSRNAASQHARWYLEKRSS